MEVLKITKPRISSRGHWSAPVPSLAPRGDQKEVDGAVLLTIEGIGASGWPAVLLSGPAIWTVPLAFVTMIVLLLATARPLPADVTPQLPALHLPERVRPPSAADRGLIAQPRPAES
jgi:hypothetical protein